MATKKKKLHPVTKYATDIVAGKITANKWVTLACKRHLKDLKRKNIYFNEAAADHIIEFFEDWLVFYEGDWDGKPFILTPNQKFIVGSIFGWKNKDGTRRFRTAYIEMGKGNGKTPIAGGVGLYGLTFDGEAGAEIYAAATTREQAGLLFRDAKLYAEGSDFLKEMLIIDKYNIANPKTNSFFRPISSEKKGLDGKKPHMALIDEIHEHRDDIVVRKMSAGAKTRRQNLTFEITNSGYDRHSICYQHHEHTEKILEGILKDDAWFGLMTGLDVCPECEVEGKTIPQDGCPDCDDWRDPAVWEKANPNMKYLGKPFMVYLKRQVTQAKAMPSQENIVKRLNFCIWTESITKWIPMDKWNICNDPVDPETLKSQTCYGGLDLSTNIDLTAWVMVFPPEKEMRLYCKKCGFSELPEDIKPILLKNKVGLEQDYLVCPNCIRDLMKNKKGAFEAAKVLQYKLIPDQKYEILCRFFLPEDNMAERVLRDKVPFDVWARQGYITLTPGDLIDYTFILNQIDQDMKDYHIAELAFDRAGSQKITTDLQDLGFQLEGDKTLIQFGQGYLSMSPPTKELQKMVLAGEIAHGKNPVLTWNVSNVSIKMDPAENIKPDKEKSIERIDGAVALIMAIGRAMLKEGPKPSIYEERGILTFGKGNRENSS